MKATVRSIVSQIDDRFRVSSIATLDEIAEATLVRERFMVQLVGFLAALALLLASIGIFCLFSYVATQRTGEIGIRMALGAQAGNVVRMLLRENDRACRRRSGHRIVGSLGCHADDFQLLFGLSPMDPKAILAATLILAVAAIGAAYLPARRASRVDPVVALRAY